MLHNEARKLVLEAWDKTHNAREIAKYFSVNESTVYRLIEERARTGSYETRTQLRDRKTILTEKQHHDILELVQEQLDITMKEIVETLHLPVGDEAVRRFLIKQGYTYKKNSSGRCNGYNSILSDVINYCIRFLKERLSEIETAALGNEAGMIGAASLL